MSKKFISRRDFVRNSAMGTVALGIGGTQGFEKSRAKRYEEKMKPEEVVKLLNQDITGEIDAILTYMRNAFVIPQCPPGHEMEEIGKDEMRHLEWLADLVTKFGGIPSMEHHKLQFGGKNTEDFINRAIELEKTAISQYKDHIKQIDHKKVVEVLNVILWEEKKHLEEFEEVLQDLKKVKS